MKMLNSRIRQLLELLQHMRSGDTPYDHSLVRQITALVRMLPSIQTDAFKQEFLTVGRAARMTLTPSTHATGF
jgi:COP9 signalosome complex subunit 6